VIDTKWRGAYQTYLIEPLLKKKWIQDRSPTTFTLAGLFLSLLIAALLPLGHPLLAFGCLVFSGFFDTLDGSLARYLKQDSPMGAALDICSDRLAEFAILLSLYLVSPQQRGLLCLLSLGSILFCITTFLVVGIFTQNETKKSFYYSIGLIERSEAFVFFGAMILFPEAFLILATTFSSLVFLTGTLRLKQFVKNFSTEVESP